MGTLADAARAGDRRATLTAMRDRIAEIIDSCESGRDIAALTKRLMEVIDELDSLPDPGAEANPIERARMAVRRRAAG